MYLAKDARQDALRCAASELEGKIDRAVRAGCTSMEIDAPAEDQDVHAFRAYLQEGGYTCYENEKTWDIEWGNGGRHMSFKMEKGE